jgi:hypothetical protein
VPSTLADVPHIPYKSSSYSAHRDIHSDSHVKPLFLPNAITHFTEQSRMEGNTTGVRKGEGLSPIIPNIHDTSVQGFDIEWYFMVYNMIIFHVICIL